MDRLLAAAASIAAGELPGPVDDAFSPAPTRTRAERAHAVVEEHFEFVWRLLRRIGVPEADVDDAAQQVFIVVSKRIDDIAEGRERTFLFGTALRTAATLRRTTRRRERWIETAPIDAPSMESAADELVERRQALAFLDDVLGAMSDDLRVVFVLCQLEEMTTAEAASVIGIATGTVASRLRRAREEYGQRVRRFRAQRMRYHRE